MGCGASSGGQKGKRSGQDRKAGREDDAEINRQPPSPESSSVETRQANRIESLEEEVETLRSKLQRYEPNGSSAPHELFTIPAEEILTFLSDIKADLAKKNMLDESSVAKMEFVVRRVVHGTIYTVEIPKDARVDAETADYLKRFEVDMERSSATHNRSGSLSRARFHNIQRLPESDEEMHALSPLQTPTPSADGNLMAIVKDPSVMEALRHLEEWGFSPFKLDEVTHHLPLSTLVYALFLQWDLVRKLNLDDERLQSFLLQIERLYHDNPYHNHIHAVDVVHCVHWFLLKCGLSGYLKEHILMAAILASAIHDVDHPGLNNAFQINTQSDLAILYSDRSVLENHHLATAFRLLSLPQFNFLSGTSKEVFREIREVMIEMVLATDMSMHSHFLSKWKSRIKGEELKFSDRNDVILILQIAMKCSDISNVAKPWDLNNLWVDRVTEEFFSQGDRERELHMSVSPLCDRSQPALGKGQKAFIDFVVKPLFESFCELFPAASLTMETMMENRRRWEELEAKQTAAAAAASSGSASFSKKT